MWRNIFLWQWAYVFWRGQCTQQERTSDKPTENRNSFMWNFLEDFLYINPLLLPNGWGFKLSTSTFARIAVAWMSGRRRTAVTIPNISQSQTRTVTPYNDWLALVQWMEPERVICHRFNNGVGCENCMRVSIWITLARVKATAFGFGGVQIQTPSMDSLFGNSTHTTCVSCLPNAGIELRLSVCWNNENRSSEGILRCWRHIMPLPMWYLREDQKQQMYIYEVWPLAAELHYFLPSTKSPTTKCPRSFS